MCAAPALTAVVPVKDFTAAKGRLAEVRTATERAALAELMAAHTVGCLAPFDPIVACDTDAVEAWATALGVRSVRTPPGLNAAVTAVASNITDGLIVICHADLAFPQGLADVLRPPRPLIVSDRHGLGTNVLVIPATASFTFAYGAGSFRLHRLEAERLGIDLDVVRDPRLAWDVDAPDDLDTPPDWGPPSWLT